MMTVIAASKTNTRTPPTIATTSQTFTGAFTGKQNTQNSIKIKPYWESNRDLLFLIHYLDGSLPIFILTEADVSTVPFFLS